MTASESWPHTGGTVPPYIANTARRFPLRAEVPVQVGEAPMAATREFKAAFKAAGERLFVSEAAGFARIWVWARTPEDAAAASAKMPALEFAEHHGQVS